MISILVFLYDIVMYWLTSKYLCSNKSIDLKLPMFTCGKRTHCDCATFWWHPSNDKVKMNVMINKGSEWLRTSRVSVGIFTTIKCVIYVDVHNPCMLSFDFADVRVWCWLLTAQIKKRKVAKSRDILLTVTELYWIKMQVQLNKTRLKLERWPLNYSSPVKQTWRQDKGRQIPEAFPALWRVSEYLVRKSRKTRKKQFVALVVILQKTVLKIELCQVWIKCVWNLWWHEDCGENDSIIWWQVCLLFRSIAKQTA